VRYVVCVVCCVLCVVCCVQVNGALRLGESLPAAVKLQRAWRNAARRKRQVELLRQAELARAEERRQQEAARQRAREMQAAQEARELAALREAEAKAAVRRAREAQAACKLQALLRGRRARQLAQSAAKLAPALVPTPLVPAGRRQQLAKQRQWAQHFAAKILQRGLRARWARRRQAALAFERARQLAAVKIQVTLPAKRPRQPPCG
jgi:hypothetical protein